MDALELTDLTRILRDCAGEEEGVDLDGDVLDATWPELGYDSLAFLQTVGHIEREYDVFLDEEALDDADTPRRFLALVNGALAARATV